MPRLIIVADDLTGAADTGACFADAGLATVIPLGGAPAPPADVVVLSTESRDLTAAEAARAVATAVAPWTGAAGDAGRPWFYKKIDSALRGHPRAELLAMLAATGATRAIVAPAFPAEGRTTRGGRQYVHGQPLEESPFGGGSSGSPSDLVALFHSENERGPAVRRLPLETVRRGPQAIAPVLNAAPGIVIADAVPDDDLIAPSRAAQPGPILGGAAGSPRALGATRPWGAATTAAPAPRGDGRVLVVAGSRHAATARQIATLRAMGVPILAPAQELLDDASADCGKIVAEVVRALARGGPAVLTTAGLDPSPRGPGSVVARLAEIATAPRVRAGVGGLVLTGGDVAAAVCAALGASALWLGGEIGPGLPWGILAGGALPGLPVATKAGSFGDDDALLACVRHLEAVARGTAARQY